MVEPNAIGGNGHGEAPVTPVPVFDDRELRALSVLLDRQTFMRMAGMQFDGRRDLYAIFGYDRLISATQYWIEYARGGIAKRIVECFPKATWRGGVELFEDANSKNDTPFEAAWKTLEKKHNIWNVLQNADILAGLSTYSVILIGAPGNVDEELPKGSPESLLYLRPFFGGGGPGAENRSDTTRTQAADADVTVESLDLDTQSPRFGEPLTYRIKRTDLSSPMLAKAVHWSRVIHVCEGALDNSVYGAPTLENVWNLLMDLEKVTGGGAESFFQRAKHSLNVNIQKDASFTDADLAKLGAKLEEYQHGITNILPTREVDVKLIEAAVKEFGQSADAIMKQIAGSKGIPMRILTGSEMGTLASEQDATNFDSQVQDRRTGYAEPMMVRRLVDRLIEYGYLPTPSQYEVGWPVEESMDEAGKGTFAVSLAQVNATFGSTVITEDEIRDWAFDAEPLTKEQKKVIADAAAKKMADAQAVMAKAAPPADRNTPPQLRAAEDAELLRVLEDAIEAGNLEVVGQIIGLQEHSYATTQVQLPEDVARKLIAFGLMIPDADLADKGREDDVHVTVKYGLIDPDAETLGNVQVQLNGRLTALKKAGKLTLTLGKTSVFSASDYDVVVVDVKSEDLAAVNRAIASKLNVAPSDHRFYVPHATVAYMRAGAGAAWAGWPGLEGVQVEVDRLVLSAADGARTEVAFG